MSTSPDITTEVGFGSPEFWTLYDTLCSKKGLTELVTDPKSLLARNMAAITHTAHLTRAIQTLSRPEHGWKHHKAWLALKHENVQRSDGQPGIDFRPGDVIVVEHGWDRDVIITHCPIERNIVSGYLLSGKWEPMLGLFLPLFDKKTIMTAIKLRLAQDAKDAMELAHEESRDWRWH